MPIHVSIVQQVVATATQVEHLQRKQAQGFLNLTEWVHPLFRLAEATHCWCTCLILEAICLLLCSMAHQKQPVMLLFFLALPSLAILKPLSNVWSLLLS